MDIQRLLTFVGPQIATFLVAVLGGIFPFVSIEVFLVAVAAIAPADVAVWPLGVVAALGQMTAKSLVYRLAEGGLNSRAGRRISPKRVADLRLRMAGMNLWVLSGFNFGSALTGIPPFFVVGPLAGAVSMSFWRFFVTGLAGLTFRLVFMVQFPHAIKGLLFWR